MLQTILVPLDGSDPSLAALRLATEVASDAHARLVLVSVVDVARAIAATSNPYAVTDPTPVIEAWREEAQSTLDSAAAGASAKNIPCEGHVAEGNPIEAILAAAHDYHADLIVMGTHGRTGLARAFLGSTTEGVLRSGHVPVLVTRGEPAEPDGKRPPEQPQAPQS